MIKNKFIGKIELMKNMNIKPNFSELARQYGVDRHTIAKYYHQEKRIPVKRNKESYLYPYLDEIKQKADLCRCTKKALFQYFQNKYGVEEFKCYNTFTYFTRKHDICTSDHSENPKLRYETEPGDQLQADRKESIKMKLKDGTVNYLQQLSLIPDIISFCIHEARRQKIFYDVLLMSCIRPEGCQNGYLLII